MLSKLGSILDVVDRVNPAAQLYHTPVSACVVDTDLQACSRTI